MRFATALLSQAAAMNCTATHDVAKRLFLQHQIESMGPVCEGMCKAVSLHPKCCGCDGFCGKSASAEMIAAQGCAKSYCNPTNPPCPNDAFMTCVEERTKVSVMQLGVMSWDELSRGMQQVQQVITDAHAKKAAGPDCDCIGKGPDCDCIGKKVKGPDCDCIGKGPDCDCIGKKANGLDCDCIGKGPDCDCIGKQHK
mmetsp:Transcript_6454/g.15843  ORF Transcript_6454/g.15843 Transcript_6454/m.15843 type:complete len:197 (+) Transcript_6454:1422-2012(+)